MGFPEDISVNGFWVDRLFYLATALTGVAFIIICAVLIYSLVCFREREGRRAHYTHGNSRGALIFTGVFSLVVFLGIDVILAVQDHHAWEAVWGNPPAESEALVVQVLPQQYTWNFRYAGADGEFDTEDDVTTMNKMHIPVDQPVIVKLKAKDVIHSFFLPNLRIKQDCIPGMITALHFEATKVGTYEIACAELCGLAHYRMRARLIVETEEEFLKWLEEYRAENDPDVDYWSMWK